MSSWFAGLAVAVSILRLVPHLVRGNLVVDEPRPYALATPLVFTFFAVLGLRAAFAIPTDVEANWPFRMRQPAVAASTAASRLLILWFGVTPVAAIELVAALAVWSPAQAIGAALFTSVIGLLLTEIALCNWTKVPFASAHEPATDSIKSRWPWYVLALIAFSFPLASLKLVAVRSPGATALAVVAGLMAVCILRMSSRYTLRTRMLTLDAPDRGPETLNLSEALH